MACSVLSSASVKSSVNQPGEGEAVDHLGRLAVGELGMVGDVGGAADLGLVAGDEHAVLGGDEVGLDVVGADLDGEVIAARPAPAVSGGPSVPEYQRYERAVLAR